MGICRNSPSLLKSDELEVDITMEVTLRGIYRKGVIELLENVEIQDNTVVMVALSMEPELTEPLINLLEQLKAEGFISNIPDEMPGEHQPVKITGKPVSEIILENRGPK
jgi:hypothetical protein